MPADCVYEHFALASSQTKHIGIVFIRIGERPKDRFRKSRFENGSEMVPIDLHQNVAGEKSQKSCRQFRTKIKR